MLYLVTFSVPGQNPHAVLSLDAHSGLLGPAESQLAVTGDVLASMSLCRQSYFLCPAPQAGPWLQIISQTG